MAQVSPARVKVKEIKQIAIAVKDIEKTVAAYWNILGIGPWEIRTWESPVVYDRKYRGKEITSVEKLAHAQVGSVELELCQPVKGDSIYQDFINEHGEGLHHLKFIVDDVDGAAAILAEEGFPSLQSGHFGPPEERGGYSYIYIEPLHAVWEPVCRGKGGILPGETTRYPAD
ncbi:VOC family protein [Chloroflexota bacterium]